MNIPIYAQNSVCADINFQMRKLAAYRAIDEARKLGDIFTPDAKIKKIWVENRTILAVLIKTQTGIETRIRSRYIHTIKQAQEKATEIYIYKAY
jgi:hypothetical protein